MVAIVPESFMGMKPSPDFTGLILRYHSSRGLPRSMMTSS